MKKQFAPLRIYREDKERFDKLLLETKHTEGNLKLSSPKLFKRMLNIPMAKDIILTDALQKRRSRGFIV